MKKFILFLCTLALVMGLGLNGAWAYMFNNGTLVEAWQGNAAITVSTYGVAPGWHDVIGNQQVFQTYGADIAGNILSIYTNWGPNDVGTQAGATTADLFLDINSDGNFEYAIKLNTALTNIGASATADIYNATTFLTSQNQFSGTGAVYGGRYDGAKPNVPVLATGSDTNLNAAISWVPLVANPDYRIDIDLTNLQSLGFLATDFAFLWATGTCANDTAVGAMVNGNVVPLPGALVLLAGGLVRLAAYGRKRKMAA